MSQVTLRHTLAKPVGERTMRTIRIADVQVPDGAGGVRFPSALEVSGLELTITDMVSDTDILATDLLLPGHGSYDSLTGVLLVNLVATDNVIVGDTLAAGERERHLVLVHLPNVLWAEVIILVQNQGSIG